MNMQSNVIFILLFGSLWLKIVVTTLERTRRGRATILAISCMNPFDIIYGFVTTHIPIFHNRVVIETRFAQPQYKASYISPVVWHLAMLLGQSHCIANMMIAAIVTGQDEIG